MWDFDKGFDLCLAEIYVYDDKFDKAKNIFLMMNSEDYSNNNFNNIKVVSCD